MGKEGSTVASLNIALVLGELTTKSLLDYMLVATLSEDAATRQWAEHYLKEYAVLRKRQMAEYLYQKEIGDG